MTVRNPEEINEEFGAAFNVRSLERLLYLYEADALLVPQAGAAPIHNREQVAQALTYLLALGGTMRYTRRHALVNGDIALLGVDWTITGASMQGQTMDLTGHTSEVVRRQADGSWKYVIDHPFDFHQATR